MCAAAVDVQNVIAGSATTHTIGRKSNAGRFARPQAPVVAVILTFNEEQNLYACLESLVGWVQSLIVVDSGSTDRTVEIAQAFGAYVLVHPFDTHSRQWQWALTQLAPGDPDWVLGLDADQRVTPELASEICKRIQHGVEGISGFYMKRRQIFRGRWIRHGGYYPKFLLKLFRREQAYFNDDELVDHHFYVSGPTRLLHNDLIEDNYKENDIAFWIQKHCRYAALMAQEEFCPRQIRGRSPNHAVRPNLFGSPDQKSLWLKNLWNRLPLYVRPWLYFFYRYVLRLGFLDGRQGLVFHFLQACWFRFMVDTYLDEMLGNERRPRNQSTAVALEAPDIKTRL